MFTICVPMLRSGCVPVVTALAASTASTYSFACYATVFSALVWENPCATSPTVEVRATVYYDIPGATLVWTGSPESVTLTPGSGFAALTALGPITTYDTSGGVGVIYRVHLHLTYPDLSTATLITDDDYTGGCA